MCKMTNWHFARLTVIMSVLAQVGAAHAASIGEVHKRILETLVIVEAQGVYADANHLGERTPVTRATGFFVDRFGTVATTRHVIDQLEAPDEHGIKRRLIEEKTKYKIIYNPTGAANEEDHTFNAKLLAENKRKDLLALQLLSNSAGSFPFMRRDKAYETYGLELSSPLHTSGFENGSHYIVDGDKLKQWAGPKPYEWLWVSGMRFKGGQSGSPIYSADGYLIGMVKGSEDGFESNGYFIPVSLFTGVVDLYDRSNSEVVTETSRRPKDSVQVMDADDSGRIASSQLLYGENEHCAADKQADWMIRANPGTTIELNSTSVVVQKGASSFKGLPSLPPQRSAPVVCCAIVVSAHRTANRILPGHWVLKLAILSVGRVQRHRM